MNFHTQMSIPPSDFINFVLIFIPKCLSSPHGFYENSLNFHIQMPIPPPLILVKFYEFSYPDVYPPPVILLRFFEFSYPNAYPPPSDFIKLL